MSDRESSSIGPNSAAWPRSPIWNAKPEPGGRPAAPAKAKAEPRPIKAAAAADSYRAAIAKAEGEGIAKADMVLRLTLKNDADLKRDRSVAVHEISFLGGEMRFLGVKVVAGGVEIASLEFATAEEEPA